MVGDSAAVATPPRYSVALHYATARDSVPVVLYTVLTPEVTGSLRRLSACGIHHVVFHRYDDNPARLREVCEWGPSEPPLRAA